ncbi:MAG: Sporulation kinase A [Firmicutes bacterium]|nr:Sporulation kinase A [Bacillota bacterium]
MVVVALVFNALLALGSAGVAGMLMLFSFRRHAGLTRAFVFAFFAALVAYGSPAGNGVAVFPHFIYYVAAYFGGWSALVLAVLCGQGVATFLGNPVVGLGVAALSAGLWGLTNHSTRVPARWQEALVRLWPALLFFAAPSPHTLPERFLSALGMAISVGMCWYFSSRGHRILGMWRFLDSAGYVLLIDEGNSIIFESSSLAHNETLAKCLRYALIKERTLGLGNDGFGEKEVYFKEGGAEHFFLLKLSSTTLPMGEHGYVAVFQNITTVKSMQKQTRQFFNLSLHGYAVLSCEGEILQVNRALAQLLGSEPKAILGKNFQEIVAPPEIEELLLIWRTLKAGSIRLQHGRCTLLTADQEEIFVSWSGKYIPGAREVHVVVQDIGAEVRRQVLWRHQINEQKKQVQLLGLVQESILVYDDEQRLVYGNAAAARLYGIDVANIRGVNVDTLLLTDYPRPQSEIKDELYNSGTWEGTITRVTPEGARLTLEVRLSLSRLGYGFPVEVIELSTDVTATMNASRQQRLLAAVVESTDDAVLSTASDGAIETWNKGASRLFGYARHEVLGKRLAEIIRPEKRQMLESALLTALAGNITADCRDIIPHQTGKEIYTSAVIAGLRNGDGQAKGISIVARDVTAERLVERELLKIEKLRISGQVAAGIGHELRNSLTTVRGFMQLFSTYQEFAAVKTSLAIVLDDLSSAHKITTNFLALASGKDEVQVRGSLNAIVERAVARLAAEGLWGRQSFRLELGPVEPLWLYAGAIEHLVINLARNGLQAMDAGGVLTIRTITTASAILLQCSDVGEGIADSLADKVGTPFFTTREGSAGLGLTVCESIAALHSAKIGFVSDSWGTTFTVAFPREQAKEEEGRCG